MKIKPQISENGVPNSANNPLDDRDNPNRKMIDATVHAYIIRKLLPFRQDETRLSDRAPVLSALSRWTHSPGIFKSRLATARNADNSSRTFDYGRRGSRGGCRLGTYRPFPALRSRMTLGTFYLIVAAALIFGACLFAARRVLPHLHARQFAAMAAIALLTVALIWTLLSMATQKRQEVPLQPATQPTPLLQPNPE